MDITISSPLKQGIKVKKWYGKNTELNSLADLLLCVSQGFGENPQNYGGIPHNGTDFVCDLGTPILASHDGEAAYYEEKDSNGNYVGYGRYISLRDRDNNFKTEYCHLSSVVKTGTVKAGEVIGLSGNTGNSTGPHLHFTLKTPNAIDPIPYLTWFEDKKNLVIIKARQLLEGYQDESGQKYWADKPERSYLIARIKDKIKDLTEVLSELEND